MPIGVDKQAVELCFAVRAGEHDGETDRNTVHLGDDTSFRRELLDWHLHQFGAGEQVVEIPEATAVLMTLPSQDDPALRIHEPLLHVNCAVPTRSVLLSVAATM